MFRIIQSIPSPKAEPFKQWLAEVGAERLDEKDNPKLAAERLRQIYKVRGYSGDWLDKPQAEQENLLTNNKTDEDFPS